MSHEIESRLAKSPAEERQTTTRPDRYRFKAGSPEHRAQLSELNYQRQIREHGCKYCVGRLDACHGTVQTLTGTSRKVMVGKDCAGFHLPAKPLRLVCECGRTPCLPNQAICVFCFDEEEALGDALYGIGFAGFEPQRVE